MQILYTIAIYMMKALISFGSLFNDKLKLGIEGRKETFRKLQQTIAETDKVFWFHCASLGEYEQGLPVFEQLKEKHPEYKIVLSFFSPSGYEIRKNSKLAHVVVYLPLDTPKNAKKFLELVHPDFTVFVKYEIWINYLNIIKKQSRRAILISALFRDHQSFFKWYGDIFKNALSAFEHIFVQDIRSELLLKRINYQNVTIAGDTRFDRVIQNEKYTKHLDFVSSFINHKICVVIGSSWPEDEALWFHFINTNDMLDVKYIIVPHNIDQPHIKTIKSKIQKPTAIYSESNEAILKASQVLIVDTIGLLSSIYSYAQIAYVGGAVGTTGLHNILEPAVFGIPIIIGNRIDKFPEATAMIKNGGVTSINDYQTFEQALNNLLLNPDYRNQLGAKNKNFIELNEGAVNRIISTTRI
ncbi:3-deoxy-D-manno-octulosonic acid transferase [Paucihalobacter sp.]|uniref:3-deoxy-D-manno-octulosonic acid transferase n=1 Tax=Paucihalobacter sp. TaxID=2850405 RepID=UPI002FE217B3